MKPGDNWVISLCHSHHRAQHDIGEPEFERRMKINMKALAEEFWRLSPYGERKQRRSA
jgi:hypothetical protein